jgi:ubiquinone/menaquinone biosynthesis C-methylase UbiE
MRDPVLLQRNYYRETADQYDRMHNSSADSHAFALAVLVSMIDLFGIQSILDVGSGTGRALLAIKRSHPAVRLIGIEPSPEMRSRGHMNGLTANELIDGDAQALSFRDESFDLVCEFGALHHIPKPRKAVCEMLRVARKGIFISDSNNFGKAI